jgi:4-hydroxy-tetrahydrodipicolinate reductase
MDGIRVVVAGAAGKMGREVIKGVGQCPELVLAGAVDITEVGEGISSAGIQISGDLEQTLVNSRANVLVDFTHPTVVATNLGIAIACGVSTVVGTTGLSVAQRKYIIFRRGSGELGC